MNIKELKLSNQHSLSIRNKLRIPYEKYKEQKTLRVTKSRNQKAEQKNI